MPNDLPVDLQAKAAVTAIHLHYTAIIEVGGFNSAICQEPGLDFVLWIV